MNKKFKLIIPILILLFIISTPALAEIIGGQKIHVSDLQANDTVILANNSDARFCQDYSVLLKRLNLEWVIMDSLSVPEAIKDKNLILIGHTDSPYTGQLIEDLQSVEEASTHQAENNRHMILEKQSPWRQDRTIYICSGSDFISRRNAAEELVRMIIADSPPTSKWIRTAYDFDLDEDVKNKVAQLQYSGDDLELPSQTLAINFKSKPPLTITAGQAANDVERLFYLLSHGYSGYGLFNHYDEFELAKNDILQELSTQTSWSGEALASLIHKQLSFISDRHMKVGEHSFAGHQDFWYNTELELILGDDGYQWITDDETYHVMEIDGEDPSIYLFPSLNRQGDPIYRIGLLSEEDPPHLTLIVVGPNQGERHIEIELQRSKFDYYSEEIFREDIIGGIPVIRIRSFSDFNSENLERFVATASTYRGTPVIIVDLRGNGGGNEYWPSNWIQENTGIRPESVFVFSELENVTSMMGRANAFEYWRSLDSDSSRFKADVDHYTHMAEAFENGTRKPRWTGPQYPETPLIANDTTIVVITNNLVASAGEGFVLRLSQAENVVVVGENSMGALTFGNISMHQLPYSKLTIWLPINFNLFTDLEIREEIGLKPDLWVPAEDALNYAVAAIRQGTLTTRQPLPESLLKAKFVPESPLRRIKETIRRFWLLIAFSCFAGAVWAYVMRKNSRLVLASGCFWFIASLAQLYL